MATTCNTIRMPGCHQSQKSGSHEPSAPGQDSARSAKDERRFSNQTTEWEWEYGNFDFCRDDFPRVLCTTV